MKMSNKTRDTPIEQYDFMNKKRTHKNIIFSVLNKTQTMFKYENLPDTTSQKVVEKFLQLNGFICGIEHQGKHYLLPCEISKLDYNFEPLEIIVNNPYLQLDNHNFSLKDGSAVLIENDAYRMGILPLISKYAQLMVENEISMRLACINSRIPFLIDTPDDRAKKSVEKLLKDIEAGKQSSMTSNQVLKSIQTTPYSHASSNLFTQLIENEQYLKATMLSEVGINANFNMKREALNSSETSLNEQTLIPFTECMLQSRKMGLDKFNKIFGENVTVQLNSIWKDNIEGDEKNETE